MLFLLIARQKRVNVLSTNPLQRWGGWADLLDNNEYEITRLQFNWLIEGKD